MGEVFLYLVSSRGAGRWILFPLEGRRLFSFALSVCAKLIANHQLAVASYLLGRCESGIDFLI